MFFGQFSWVGVVSNLLIVPIVPVIVGASLLAWVLFGVAPELSQLIVRSCVAPLALWCAAVSNGFGSQPWAAIQTPPIPAFLVAGFYFFAVMLWRPRPRQADE